MTSDIQDRINDIVSTPNTRPSGDPRHPCNADDPYWQAGYFYGTQTEKHALEDLREEWEACGRPPCACLASAKAKKLCADRLAAFTAWKTGYWAGRFSVVKNIELETK